MKPRINGKISEQNKIHNTILLKKGILNKIQKCDNIEDDGINTSISIAGKLKFVTISKLYLSCLQVILLTLFSWIFTNYFALLGGLQLKFFSFSFLKFLTMRILSKWIPWLGSYLCITVFSTILTDIRLSSGGIDEAIYKNSDDSVKDPDYLPEKDAELSDVKDDILCGKYILSFEL